MKANNFMWIHDFWNWSSKPPNAVRLGVKSLYVPSRSRCVQPSCGLFWLTVNQSHLFELLKSKWLQDALCSQHYIAQELKWVNSKQISFDVARYASRNLQLPLNSVCLIYCMCLNSCNGLNIWVLHVNPPVFTAFWNICFPIKYLSIKRSHVLAMLTGKFVYNLAQE